MASRSVFAEGLLNRRILAVSPEGRVYVSRREQGDVPMNADRDEVLAATRGHVSGNGERVGTYAQPVAPPK